MTASWTRRQSGKRGFARRYCAWIATPCLTATRCAGLQASPLPAACSRIVISRVLRDQSFARCFCLYLLAAVFSTFPCPAISLCCPISVVQTATWLFLPNSNLLILFFLSANDSDADGTIDQASEQRPPSTQTSSSTTRGRQQAPRAPATRGTTTTFGQRARWRRIAGSTTSLWRRLFPAAEAT